MYLYDNKYCTFLYNINYTYLYYILYILKKKKDAGDKHTSGQVVK